MKNKLFLTFLILILIPSGCSKDDSPVVVHSHLTRITYNVSQPSEMPHLEFVLNNTYNLTGNVRCSVTLVADEHASLLNLMIMLEDENGDRTDESPFVIPDSEIIKDDRSHTYTYSFDTRLQSSTSSTGEIDICKVKKILVYINAGIAGKVSEGYFWLDKVQFDQD